MSTRCPSLTERICQAGKPDLREEISYRQTTPLSGTIARVAKWSFRRLGRPMGVYYKCLCGDSEHLALMERNAVAVRDAAGRNWICYPIAGRQAEKLPMTAHLSEVLEADATARRQGLGGQGTEVRIYYCEDENELMEKLLLDTSRESEP